MSAAYKLWGVHCKECAKEMELDLKHKVSPEISIDYTTGELLIPDDADMETIENIAAFNKIRLVPGHASHPAHEEEHDAHHGHSHSHELNVDFSSSDQSVRTTKIVFAVNLFFSVIEFIFGVLFNSAAILTDAVHDLGDALSVGLAWFFQRISVNEPDAKFSFGYRRFSLLGALITAVVLLVGAVSMIIHSAPQLLRPEPIHTAGVFWMALFAIAGNGYSAWLLSKGKSVNEALLNIHIWEDLIGWIAVLVMSVILRFTSWYILDPLLSILIALWILIQTIPQFKRIVETFLGAVPRDISQAQVKQAILSLPGVTGLSHLHIWSIDGRENAASVTVSTDIESSKQQRSIKFQIQDILANINVVHSTIEFFYDEDNSLN